MLKKIITAMVSLLTIGGAFANPQKIVKKKVISSTKILEFGCRLNLKNQKIISS